MFVDGAAAESAFQWAHSLRSHNFSAAPSLFAISLQLSLSGRTVAAANDIVCRFFSSVGGETSGNERTTLCRLEPEKKEKKMISRELCLHICLFFFFLLLLHFRLSRSRSHWLACEHKDSSDNVPLGLFVRLCARLIHFLGILFRTQFNAFVLRTEQRNKILVRMECSFVCLFSNFPLTIWSCAALCAPRSPLRKVQIMFLRRRRSLPSNRNVICAWRACEHLFHRKAKRHYHTRIQKSLLMGRSANSESSFRV